MRTEKIIIPLYITCLICTLFLDFPGSSLITILAGLALALMYFPAGFYFLSDKTLKQQNVALSIIGGLFMFTAVLGILFKFMHWPGRAILLLSSFAILSILFVISFAVSKKAKEELETYYKNYVIRCGLWASLAFLVYFIPNTIIIKARYSYDPFLLDIRMKQEADPENDLMYEMELQKHWMQQDSIAGS